MHEFHLLMTLNWVQDLRVQHILFHTNNILDQQIFGLIRFFQSNFFCPTIFCTIFLDTKFFHTQIYFGPKLMTKPFFSDPIFSEFKIFLASKLFGSKIFWPIVSSESKLSKNQTAIFSPFEINKLTLFRG